MNSDIKEEHARMKLGGAPAPKADPQAKLTYPKGITMRGPRLLVQLVIVKATKEGILLPENFAKRQNVCEGTVVAVGEGHRSIDGANLHVHPVTAAAVGDRINFVPEGIDGAVTIDEVNYVSIKESAVICVVENEKTEFTSKKS